MASSQIVGTGFDVTWPAKAWDDEHTLGLALNEWCSKYDLRKEQSEAGYLHCQCRVRLIKKRRVAEAISLVASFALQL